jgi:hypothetical protein
LLEDIIQYSLYIPIPPLADNLRIPIENQSTIFSPLEVPHQPIKPPIPDYR